MYANLNILEIPKTVEAVVDALKAVGDGWDIDNEEIEGVIDSFSHEKFVNLWFHPSSAPRYKGVIEIEPFTAYWNWDDDRKEKLIPITFLDLLKEYDIERFKKYVPYFELAKIYI